ncbi:MAG: hypothetical protein FJX03_01645 [Alphaproteobacteria bacterium]|nr:hypothetical protein [Alphaproteobacteria bacterium]
MTNKITTNAFTMVKDGEKDQALAPNWATFLYQDPSLRKFEETEAIGYGIERCLYELNPELTCLSPSLIHAAVLTPAEALLALEEVAAQPNRPSFPVDRHLAAFLMSRWREMNFLDMRDMGKPQRETKNLATLRILAGIQTQMKIKELPNLCLWMAELCVPLITQYHNLKARAVVQGELSKATRSGQLSKLMQVLENRQALTQDREDYQAAKIEVLLIEAELREIESKILNRNRLASKRDQGIWGGAATFFYWLKTAYPMRTSSARMAQLHHQSELLKETWGTNLVPQRKRRSAQMWERFKSSLKGGAGAKPQPTSLQKSVDAPIKYD